MVGGAGGQCFAMLHSMNIGGKPFRTLRDTADGIEVIDQRHLPHRLVTAELRTPEEVAVAIREMWVRGAPLIGAVAAYGLAFAVARGDDPAKAAARLQATRPTAVNLKWALQVVLNAIQEPNPSLARRANEAARQITADELERSRRIGEHGLALIRDLAA